MSIPFRVRPRTALWQSQTFWLARRRRQNFVEVINRPKFRRYITRERAEEFLLALTRDAVFVNPTTSINSCRDPKDNMILELAVDGKADYIITGDDDLLSLHPFQGISILTPEAFLDAVASP